MAHTEGPWQKVPLALLAAGCLALGVDLVKPSHAARRVFLALMLIFVTSGVAGAVLHFESNIEFAKELDPELSGGALLGESLAGSTPALAPGVMVLLAAIGWACARSARPASPPAQERDP